MRKFLAATAAALAEEIHTLRVYQPHYKMKRIKGAIPQNDCIICQRDVEVQHHLYPMPS